MLNILSRSACLHTCSGIDNSIQYLEFGVPNSVSILQFPPLPWRDNLLIIDLTQDKQTIVDRTGDDGEINHLTRDGREQAIVKPPPGSVGSVSETPAENLTPNGSQRITLRMGHFVLDAKQPF